MKEQSIISPCETAQPSLPNAIDDFLGEEDKGLTNLSIPNNISLVSSMSCLSDKETLSDESSSCTDMEDGGTKSKPVSISPDDKYFVTPEKENVLSKYEAQSLELKHKETIILSQRNELKQYNTMVLKYRDSIRTKNNAIKALESKLKEKSDSKEVIGDSELVAQESATFVRQDSQLSSTSLLKENVENESNEYTIEMMKKEMGSLRTIIESLTNENNTFRRKETDLLQKLSDSRSQVQPLLSQINSLRESLEFSRTHSQSLKRDKDEYQRKVLQLEERLNESQIQIFEVGQKAIHIERESESKQANIVMLEKLLDKSRDLAAVASNEKAKETRKNKENDSSQYLASFSSLHESLKKELNATRKREQDLRAHISQGLDENGTKFVNDSIMDKLTESQQEAILYLTGEVEDLRQQLEKECRGKEHLDEISLKKDDQIKILKRENEMIAADLVLLEKKLEALQNNFSTKSGENACLRDEVKELSLKVARLKDLESLVTEKDKYCAASEEEVMTWKVLLEKKCDECKDLSLKLENSISKVQYEALYHQFTEAEKRIHKAENERMNEPANVQNANDGDDRSESKYPMVTIDINDNGECQDFSHGVMRVSPDRKVEKAVQETYEKKIDEAKREVKEKNIELDLLKSQLDSLALKYDEDMRESNVRKICYEAETHFEQEELRNLLKERDQEILILKRKVSHLQNCGLNWQSEFKNVSETISSGVEASIELFSSLSFHEDDEDDGQRKDKDSNALPSKPVEIAVPLQPSKSFDVFHTSDDIIEGGQVEVKAARRNGRPPLASSKSFDR